MKKILVQFNMPGMTSAQYDKIWQDLYDAGQANPKGMLYHFGAMGARDWVVVEIWESDDDFKEFGKKLMPILEKNGAKGEPTILPLYYSYSGA